MPREWWEEETTTGRWRPLGVRRFSCEGGEERSVSLVTCPHLQHSSNMHLLCIHCTCRRSKHQHSHTHTYMYTGCPKRLHNHTLNFANFCSHLDWDYEIQTVKFFITVKKLQFASSWEGPLPPPPPKILKILICPLPQNLRNPNLSPLTFFS